MKSTTKISFTVADLIENYKAANISNRREIMHMVGLLYKNGLIPEKQYNDFFKQIQLIILHTFDNKVC